MPLSSDKSIPDRADALRVNTHPRLEEGGLASIINTPDDILEGIGDLTEVSANGDPAGWTLGRPEEPDGRNVYIGPAPDQTWLQNTSTLGRNRQSFLVNQPVVESRPPPTSGTPLLARIPRPEKPVVKIVAATEAGYPASTTQSPYWIAFSRSLDGTRHTLLGPATPFQLGEGQSARVLLPEDTPVRYLGLWMSEPGKSRPERPGPMRLQRVVDLQNYFLPHYDLTGPYRSLRSAPTKDETKLPAPSKPGVSRVSSPTVCRPGSWICFVTWSDDTGESLPSSTASVVVPLDEQYTERNDDFEIELAAGRGYVRVTRPKPPPGAKGWRAYAYISDSEAASWHRIYDRLNNIGDEKPFSFSTSYIQTAGWGGTEKHATNDRVVLVSADRPIDNTSGIEPPEDAPEEPFPIGNARPAEGRWAVRVTDTVGEAESLPSEAVPVNLPAASLMNILFVNPDNRFPTLIETRPGNLPMHWDVTAPVGAARMEGEELVLDAVSSGATHSAAPEAQIAAVDPLVASSVEGAYAIEDPGSGTLDGSAEAVLRETSTTGAVTERVLQTSTAPGGYEVYQPIEPAGSGGFAWTPATAYVQLLFRLAGSTKNLKLRIIRAYFKKHRRRFRRPRSHWPPGRPPTPPPIKPPPPHDTRVEPPPEPPWSPETYPVEYPDRPLLVGEVLEQHNFESSMPSGWSENVTGIGTITRVTGTSLSGNGYLRFSKGV